MGLSFLGILRERIEAMKCKCILNSNSPHEDATDMFWTILSIHN